MNFSILRFILGHVIKLEALFFLLPCITALIYGERTGWYFLVTAVFCFFIGFLMTLKKPTDKAFYLKEGCVATALSWIFMSFFGCLPLWISGEIPCFVDALFETISGFTTTGATILSNVEELSHCALMWRSFTHWIGGMGVLVFLLAIIPLSGGSSINLMRAESPGPSVGKLVPKIRYSARILYLIYLFMTVLEFGLLVFGGMPLFDAMATSFATAGTGGFGIKADSIASYSTYLQWVITIFMLLFSVNFNAYYLLLLGDIRRAFAMEEVRHFFFIVLASTTFIFFQIIDNVGNVFQAITQSSFQVAAIISSTGFSTVDYNAWNTNAKSVLVLLMFIGACAGSTGGGIKVSRLSILLKTVVKELNSYIHPRSIKKIKMDGKTIEHDVVRSVNVYFITFMLLFSFSVLLISLEGKDLITSFTAVIATINNIGPGLELVGPSSHFGHFNIFSKAVLMFDMLAGRLELFPLLILFHPGIWKEV